MVSVGSKDHEHHHGLQWQHRSPSVAWLPAAAQATVVPQGDPIQKMRHSSSLTSCSESYLSCSWAACSGAGPLRAPSCLQSPVSAWCSSPHSRGGGQPQRWLCAACQACRRRGSTTATVVSRPATQFQGLSSHLTPIQ